MATVKNKKGGKGKKGKDGCVPPLPFQKVAEELGKDWKKLGRVMGLQDANLDSIAQEHSEDVYEMAYQMLRVWRQTLGTKANPTALKKHLNSINRNDIVVAISKNSSPTFNDDVSVQGTKASPKHNPTKELQCDLLTDVHDKLVEEYQALTMKGLPWMNELVLTLDEYYVELSLTKMDKIGIELPSEPINIDEIFIPVSNDKRLPRILIEGGPGMGKSTLAAKLAYDWAKQYDYIKHFDLVVLIPLRHFAGKLEDIICSAVPIEKLDYKHMLKIYQNKTKSVLFVMDGYDEISSEMKDVILPMLRREVYSHTTVIVTSRPGKFPINTEVYGSKRLINPDVSTTFSHFVQKRINVKGFNDEQKVAFTKRHTESCSEEEKKSIKLKLDDMVDADFLKCPLFLLMLIVTLTDNLDKENPSETKTDLYKQVFNCVIRRYLSKMKQDVVSGIDLFLYTGSMKPLQIELMEQFSKFSLWAIRSSRVSFSYDDIVSNANNDPQILELGFLTQSVITKRLRKTLVYEPVHKSLLEFAAAYSAWMAFVDGNYQTKQWKEDVISLTHILTDSLCFPFLLGLMGKKADTIFNVLLSNKWQYALKFRNWYNVLVEMDITDSVLKSLSPFLPPVWHIGWDHNDCGIPVCNKHEDIVRSGIQEGRIKQIKWDILHDVSIPTDLVVDTLVLWNSDDFKERLLNQPGISKQQMLVKCKNLWCHFRQSIQPDVFARMLQVIDFEHLTVSLHSNMLPDIHHFLTEGKLKCRALQWLIVELRGNEPQIIDTGIRVIRSKTVKRLGLQVWQSILQTTIDRLIIAAASSELTAFTLTGEHGQLAVDIGDLCQRGRKSWDWLELKGVKIACRSEIHKHFSVTCLDLPLTCGSERPTHFINHCRVTSLTCSASLLFACLDSWPLCKTLTELFVIVDESMVKDGISTVLAIIRNLQVLGLIMSPNYSLACRVEEWLLVSQTCIRLKGIEICGTNENKKLAMELVESIVEFLPAHTSDSTLQPAPLSSTNSQSKTIQLQYLMVNNRSVSNLNPVGEFHSLLDFAQILKPPLADNRLPCLEIVSTDVASIDLNRWLEEFPFDEGFRIDYDIWGERKEDTIKSKMINGWHPGLVKRIVVTFEQTIVTTCSKPCRKKR